MSVGRITVALLLAGASCANLPELPAGTCGNHVVEPHEDCDGFAPDATSVCIPKGSVGECHLDCGRRSDGSRPSCPAGWGCGLQGLCHPPTGDFEATPEFKVGGAWSLMTGDFDGDGRGDVIDFEQPDIAGVTRLRFHYFDENGLLSDTRAFPKTVTSAVVTRPAGAVRNNLVFSDARFSVGVILGQVDRSAVPEAFSSYHLKSTGARMIAVHDTPIGDSSAIVILTTIADAPGLYVVDQTLALRRQGDLPGPIEALVGDPVDGNVIEDPDSSPCREMVLAVRGAASFSLVDTCTRASDTGSIVWRDQAQQMTVVLDPPVPIDAAPQLVDINGDGHLDVLLGAGARPYVAFGDGRGLATAIPYRLPLANPGDISPDIPMPLAAGDFTGDGAVDFVFSDRLLVSMPSADSPLPIYLRDPWMLPTPWTVARIADFNGNGKLDVAAASSDHLGIDFFNGTGGPYLLPFSIPTDAPVRYLAATDLDGDLINDLAFLEAGSSDTERDSLMIAYGNAMGAPGPGVPVARINGVDGISVLFEFGRGNLVVASHEGGTRGESVLAVLMGSGDRLPFAPYRLVDISPQGLIATSAALGVAVGAYTGTSKDQLLTLTTDGDPLHNDYRFWLLPALETSEGPALSIGGQLDSRLQPVYAKGTDIGFSLAGAAADLDGDGRDEALWVMSADETTRCALVIVDVAGGGGAGGTSDIVARDPILLDERCLQAQVLPVDVDGDGHVDLALLTGASGQNDRRLRILWNDGSGRFASSSITTVTADGESPEQFTVLPATPGHPFRFAYVTDGAAMEVSATGAGARAFGASRTLAELQHGTGIVAADVNGDGVPDLAVAARGNIRVLKAQLAPP